jgi:hypothetical protein
LGFKDVVNCGVEIGFGVVVLEEVTLLVVLNKVVKGVEDTTI